MNNLHTVDGVDWVLAGSRMCWAVASTGPDGVRRLHVFPPDTLAWRAAEYGIDPADSHTLLDIVLHERFMTNDEHNEHMPDFVHNTDAARARAAHLARVGVVKQRARVVDPDNLLAAIHDSHAVDPDEHKDRLRQIAALRAQKEAQRRG